MITMKKSKINSFAVYGLFGTDNVYIPFDEDVKILVGENGLGKTQILNLFYYTLTTNFFKLTEFNFEKLVLEFEGQEPIELPKFDLEELIKDAYNHPAIEAFIDRFGYTEVETAENLISQIQDDVGKLTTEFDHLRFKYGRTNIRHLIKAFREREQNLTYSSSSFFYECEKKIKAGLTGCEVIYFPTYRRVEENLQSLGYNENPIFNQENTLIQFGMGDVQKRFNHIETTIDKYLKDGFSKITSEILNQLVKGFEKVDRKVFNRIDKNDIDIILARVGLQLPDDNKDEIRNMILTGNFENPSSTYLLHKLVEIYEEQRELDDAVKLFRDICNAYLVNKQVFYDESAIKIFVKSTKTRTEIPLNKLSLGEKQIISIFSKVYLSEQDKRFIVLFDEPELSLSIKWQQQLLPDILNSNKCDFLLAVTHSPFIFDNELDKYGIGLNEYITPTKTVLA